MNLIVAIGLSVAGAYVLYLLVRIAHDIHSDRQVAKAIEARKAMEERHGIASSTKE